MCYSQYPVKTKIGNDSVVVISLPQAEKINQQYLHHKDTLRQVMFSLDSLNVVVFFERDYNQRVLDDIRKENATLYQFKPKYYETLAELNQYKEYNHKDQRKQLFGFTIYAVIATVLASLAASL